MAFHGKILATAHPGQLFTDWLTIHHLIMYSLSVCRNLPVAVSILSLS